MRALEALLDRIGPAVVLVHSQSGAYGMDLGARTRADGAGVRQCRRQSRTGDPDEVVKTFSKVPLLAVLGRQSAGAPGPERGRTPQRLRRHGERGESAARGSAKFLLLPEAGHKGNSHMLMMEKNNLQIADLIIGWLGESVPTR